MAEAYGWPDNLTEQEILMRLVALNTLRTTEELAGTVLWLRPTLQNPDAATEQQAEIDLGTGADREGKPSSASKSKQARLPWPVRLPDRIRALQKALAALPGPVAPAVLARRFVGAPTAQVSELLDTLFILGQARQTKNGKYVTQG